MKTENESSPSICVKCEFHSVDRSPVTPEHTCHMLGDMDFVTGLLRPFAVQNCYVKNPDGNCSDFKLMSRFRNSNSNSGVERWDN